MSELSVVKTVIFDLFGTLVQLTNDSKPYAKLIRREKTINRRHALTLSMTQNFSSLAEYAEAIGLNNQHDILEIEKELHTDIDSVELYNDTLPVLHALKAQNIKIVLLSNLASPYKRVLAVTGIADLFDSVVFSCDCGFYKPQQQIYISALQAAASKPDETIMVGDNFTADVNGPSQLGITGIHLQRQKNITQPASHVMTSLNDIHSYLR